MKDCKYALEIMKQELKNKYITPEIKYAFEASIEALEKQIPKEAIEIERDIYYKCPSCGDYELEPCEEYCPTCGTKIQYKE